MGFSGVMLYSYDSMTGGQGRPSPYLATLQRRAFRAPALGQTGACPLIPRTGPPGLAAAGAYLADARRRRACCRRPCSRSAMPTACSGGIDLAVPADAIYDLASLTKVLATGLVAAHLFATRQLDLDAPVTDCAARMAASRRAPTSVIRDLLTHASGLPAHLPLYEHISGPDAIVAAIAAAPLVAPPRTTAIYSDLGFIVLGRALERVAGEPLDAQATTLLAGVDRRCHQRSVDSVPADARVPAPDTVRGAAVR